MWSSGSEGGGGEKDQVCRISLGLAPLQFSLLTLQPLNQKTEPFFFGGGGGGGSDLFGRQTKLVDIFAE